MNNVFLQRVSIAILSYNRKEELLSTLGSVWRPQFPWHEVIVADNGSSDGTIEAVSRLFPSVRILRFENNIGIEASNRAYIASTAPWVLSLDDDSAPAADTFEAINEELSGEPRAAALALSVRRSAPKVDSTGRIETAYGFSSAGVLFNRTALDSIGTYDPELFLFTNELHWTARALLKGWSILKHSGAVVIHRSSARNRSSARHAFFYTRNLLLFLLRYAPSAERVSILNSYMRELVSCSLLHHSAVYLKACRSAWKIAADTREKIQPLPSDLFHLINPDLRAGFGYLG